MAEYLKRRMSDRPKPGQRVTVFFRDGAQKECHATKIIGQGYDGIFLYHKKKMLDEVNAIGWWPTTLPGREAG